MKPRTRRLLAAATIAAVSAVSTVALAASDFQTSFTESGTFKWDGGVATSVAPLFDGETCTSSAPVGRYCERTLIELKKAGKLSVTINDWNEDSDLDLFLHASDADGTFGDEVAEPPLGSGPGPEKITVNNLPAGYYLAIVNYFQSVESGYKGQVDFVAPGGTPTATPTPTPAPTATPESGGGGSPPPSTTQPGALPSSGTLAVDMAVNRSKIKTLRKKGAAVRVGCTVTCKGTVTAKIGRKKVGRASFSRTHKSHPPVVIKLSSAAKRKLAKAKRAKLTFSAVVTDSSGGQRKTMAKRATYKR